MHCLPFAFIAITQCVHIYFEIANDYNVKWERVLLTTKIRKGNTVHHSTYQIISENEVNTEHKPSTNKKTFWNGRSGNDTLNPTEPLNSTTSASMKTEDLFTPKENVLCMSRGLPEVSRCQTIRDYKSKIVDKSQKKN